MQRAQPPYYGTCLNSTDPHVHAAHDKATLDAAYNGVGQQVWLTEFGAPDTIPGMNWADGAPAVAYIDEMVQYFTTSGKVALWFIFESGTGPEHPQAIHLYNSATGNLTTAGERYKQWATRCDGSNGNVTVSTTRFGPQDCRVTITTQDPLVLPIDAIAMAASQAGVSVQLDTMYSGPYPYHWVIGNRNSVHFDMHRDDPNVAMTQTFTVYRACGAWPAFAGMGPG